MIPIPRLIFGGSFNPIHKGHLEIIDFVLKNQICFELYLIPNYQSPFKENTEYAPADIRLEMIQYSVKNYFSEEFQKKIKILDIEIKEKKISYTAETLEKIQDNVKTGILIGSDNIKDLPKWKKIEWIFTYYPFYVIYRNNQNRTSLKKEIEKIKSYFPSANFYILDFSPRPCKSKEIREQIKNRESYEVLKNCLTSEAFSIIKKYQLYL